MDENKKKNPDEEEEKKAPDTSEEKKNEPKADEKSEDKSEDKSADDAQQTDDKGENAEKPSDDEQKEQPVDKPQEQEKQQNAPDEKDEEILRLKTQIAAMQLGISGDCMEDAVAIAESYVKSGKAADINAALQAVVKKYPDMKAEGKDAKDGKSKGGFKVGADSSGDGKKADDEKLNNAFGIKKKK